MTVMPSTDPDYNKKYYLRNKERLLKRRKMWYAANRKAALEYQNEWNRLNRPSKRVAQGRTLTISGKVRVVLPRKSKRSRNNPPVSGEAGLPTGEHGGAMPDVPRPDRAQSGSDEDGNGIE